ncbi:PTS sugar transporter subunit IIA [Rubrivivax rivuli]|uniref:PTS fructose transporter subunit IIA n=1 Tax=Rubrivivax rivuli TaxID=1862385 RepID=A0A437RQF5_9BURK|nr:PTS fructose transporter subunit IIA [Rubrivivax rivuli]RVU49016.1 PTS fructose transporter subunit IIA [Rubrivivax rivuli]
MASILLVAHAPLASALLEVARHAYADCDCSVAAVDVPPTATLESAAAQVAGALQGLPSGEVLVLADAFGATPSNAALAAVDGVQARVVTGVNVPMVWRVLCYGRLPLADLVTRAVDGGRQGIMQVATPRRQNQPQRPLSDDPDQHPDQ